MRFQNLSAPDRIVRLLLGVLMLWSGWSLGGATEIWPIALRIFAWFPLVTGAWGWCPIYAFLGLSTGKAKGPPRDR